MHLQVGGAVRAGAPYVEREADRALPDALLAGELCYVLAPRQIGKSSLRVRAAARLREAGCRVSSVDLSGLGAAGLDPETWFFGLACELADGIGLDDPAEAWEATAGRPPAARWLSVLERCVVRQVGPPTVIFLDEIDAVQALPFGGEDLFAAIRAAHDRRAEDPAWERLRFALLGVASPADLIQDPRRTPFNVGRSIRLDDFSAAEARALLPWFAELEGDPAALLEQVLRWTEGHPFQTAQIGAALAEDGGGGDPATRVEAAVRRLYLSSWPDPGLDAAGRALRDAASPELLTLYRRALVRAALPWDARSPWQSRLRLTGLAAVRAGRLVVRNEIVRRVYTLEWIDALEGRRELRALAWAWVEAGRPEAALASGADLAQLSVVNREELDREEAEYLLRSEAKEAAGEAARRAASRARRLGRLALALALIGLIAGGLAWRERRDTLRLSLAQEMADLPALAEIPGRQQEALERALGAWRALQETPFAALATRGLAETVEHVRGPALGAGGAMSVRWLDDRTLLVGRDDGRLDKLVKDGELQASLRLDSAVSAIALDPNAPARALLGTLDGSVLWWDVAAHRPLGEPRLAHARSTSRSCLLAWTEQRAPGVRAAEIAATGVGLTLGAEGGVSLWDPGAETPRRLPVTGAMAARFSPDGGRVAVATSAGTLQLFDAASGALLETRGPWPGAQADPYECEQVQEHPDALTDLAASSDGRLAAVGRHGIFVITGWDADSPTLTPRDTGLAFWKVAISPDAGTLATADERGTVAVWDARTGALRTRHGEPGEGGALALRFSPDGRLLVSSGHDDRVWLWDVGSGDLLWHASGLAGGTRSGDFSASSLDLAMVGEAGLFRYGTTRSVALDAWRSPDRGRPSSLSVSPRGEVALAWTDGPPEILLPGGGRAADQPLPDGVIDTVAFSPDGGALAWSSAEGTRLSARGGPIGERFPGRAVYWSSPWSSDGQRLALFDQGDAVLVGPEGAPIARAPGPFWPGMRLSPDGARVLAVARSGPVVVLDAATGAELYRRCRLGTDRTMALAWRRDGRRFAAASTSDWLCLGGPDEEDTVETPLEGASRFVTWAGDRVWGFDNGDRLMSWDGEGRLLQTLVGHAGQVRGADRSPDERRLVSSSADGDVRLWSTQGEVLASWQAHQDVARHVAFSADGASLYSAGDDGLVLRLPGSAEALAALACQWLAQGDAAPEICTKAASLSSRR